MNFPTVRLSKRAKDQLTSLKRKTGIPTWNVLCRWAICRSLQDEGAPLPQSEKLSDGIEIEWPTLAGTLAPILEAAILQRCIDDDLPMTEKQVARQVRLHVHRGIGLLAGDPSLHSIDDFVGIVVSEPSVASE